MKRHKTANKNILNQVNLRAAESLKKEAGSYRSVSNKQFSPVIPNEMAIKPEKAFLNFEFQQGNQMTL